MDHLDVSSRPENCPSGSFCGLPCAVRSYIVQENDLNPEWNEGFEFFGRLKDFVESGVRLVVHDREVAGEKGSMIGYQVRLESKRTDATKVLFCTTGIALRMLLSGAGERKAGAAQMSPPRVLPDAAPPAPHAKDATLSP